MPAPYRVALQGFSDFERTTLSFCFRQALAREPAYVHVDAIAGCDFIVADASHAPLTDSVTRNDRLSDTLFIGDNAPTGAIAQLRRPIDPERILRALDGLAARRRPAPGGDAPDIMLPLDRDSDRFPTLDTADIVDTTPAAFQHEPIIVSFTDLASINAASAPAPLQAAPTPAPPLRRGVPPDGPEKPSPAKRASQPPVRMTEEERVAAKAAARRASRLARIAQSGTAATDVPHNVLLLDGSTPGDGLEWLLTAFGFEVHRVDTLAAAMSALERTPLVAAFIDVDAYDATGFDGLDLCKRVKQRQLPLAGGAPAVMLLSTRDSASGRVRAKLAGADAFLTRPVTRGDAARALEACSIVLPADARRA